METEVEVLDIEERVLINDLYIRLLKRRFDRLGVAFGRILKMVLNDKDFPEYVRTRAKEFSETNTQERRIMIKFDKETFNKLEELMNNLDLKDVRKSKKLIIGLAIEYFFKKLYSSPSSNSK